jgi:SDR family mycofactocin-dependent oxidoreductase
MRLDGKVAFVTGAARGMGRSHAVRLAAEGADVVVTDLCAEAAPVDYAAAVPDDLTETVHLVEEQGRRVVARVADVRDQKALDAAVADGVAELGRLDIVVANAGITSWSRFWEMSEDQWQAVVDVDLTGVWKTLKAATPVLIEQGTGGSLIAISSVAGLKALPGQAHYSAARHGVVGLVKTAAIELGPFGIRVNSIHPWGVATAMAEGSHVPEMLAANPGYAASYSSILPDPPIARPEDISDAVAWLASDQSRCVTGIQLPVDMGATAV